MILPKPEEFHTFKSIPGALSVCECIAIINIAAQVPQGGVYLELGTHKGKSAYAATYSLPAGVFNLVDPIFEDTDLSQRVQYFVANSVNKILFCPTLAETSLEAIPKFSDLSYVFVDSGSHGDGLPMQEVLLLEDKTIKGGIIAFHDYKNQFVEVEGAYNYLLSTGKYEEIEIDWKTIIDYVVENNLEEENNSWHQYPELPHPPNFIGALRRK